ncbi:MAG TPA: hypothetical protein VEC93_10030 [Anaerolineae bacterium]|nr:hypothetical protein [Anaerolineae bacterium]
MKILAILVAILVLLIGLRLVLTAVQAAITGKILVRQGIRSKWQPAPTRNDVWKAAIRDGLMGLLLIVLGGVLVF